MSDEMHLDERFRCFWETIELERGLEKPKKCKPIRMRPTDLLKYALERLEKFEFAVKVYHSQAICPNGHTDTKDDYLKLDDKYCGQCGAKLLTITSKEHWEPCRLIIAPVVPESTFSTEKS